MFLHERDPKDRVSGQMYYCCYSSKYDSNKYSTADGNIIRTVLFRFRFSQPKGTFFQRSKVYKRPCQYNSCLLQAG